MNKAELKTKNILIQQCNHWFSEYTRLKKYSATQNNEHLIIEALGCAKGNLCILKEIDLENQEKYIDLLNNIDTELNNIYKKKNIFLQNYNSLLYSKILNDGLSKFNNLN